MAYERPEQFYAVKVNGKWNYCPKRLGSSPENAVRQFTREPIPKEDIIPLGKDRIHAKWKFEELVAEQKNEHH